MSKTVILLHGALGSKEQFNEFIKELPKEWNSYSFDFEGHGINTLKKDFCMKTFVGNTVDFMKEHQIEKSYFFGYSMGGYVALNLAKFHPNLVEGITSLGTKFEWNPSIAANEIGKLQADLIEKKLPKFAALLKNRHANWKVVLQKTANMMLELGNGKGKLSDEDLASIKHQVLVCLGDKDQMVGLEESKKASKALANSRFKLIEGLAHPFDGYDGKAHRNLAGILIENINSQAR